MPSGHADAVAHVGMVVRTAALLLGARVTMLVSQPVAWKNDPYSREVLPPPITTARRGS